MFHWGQGSESEKHRDKETEREEPAGESACFIGAQIRTCLFSFIVENDPSVSPHDRGLPVMRVIDTRGGLLCFTTSQA